VHDLDSAGGAKRIFAFPAAGFGSGESEDGAKSLAAGENGVTHGLMDGPGAGSGAGEEGIQRIIDERLLAFEVGFEVGHGPFLKGESSNAKL